MFSLQEFVDHFEAFILPQADMRVEAANLDVFNDNFEYARSGNGLPVRFPLAVQPYVSEAVLVMTYVHATPMTELLDVGPPPPRAGLFRKASHSAPKFLRRETQRTHCCLRVGKVCLDAFLQMMFRDRCIHGDMHPGNMLVRLGEDGSDPELVVIDAGLAVRMGPVEQQNFADLMYSVAMKDGRSAGRLMVERSSGDRSAVIDEDGFVENVGDLVSSACSHGFSLGKWGIGDTLRQILQLAYNHNVKLDTSFVTVVTSIVVLEGVSRQLDPDTDVLKAATPYLARAAASHLLRRK